MKRETTRNTKGTNVFMAFLCLLCLLWLRSLSIEAQTTLDQVFAKMDAVAKTFHSVQSDLERTNVTVIVDDKDIASGKFYYEKQNNQPRVKVELTKPAPQLVLIDKGKLQLYSPNVKTLQEFSLSGHQDKVDNFMSLGFGQSSQDLKKNFDVTLGGEETIDGVKTVVLDLKPKTPSGFSSIKLWIDQKQWMTYQQKFTETGKDYSVLKYPNAKLNPNIADSIFKIDLPKNVNIIKG